MKGACTSNEEAEEEQDKKNRVCVTGYIEGKLFDWAKRDEAPLIGEG